jgi:hypothetical protein
VLIVANCDVEAKTPVARAYSTSRGLSLKSETPRQPSWGASAVSRSPWLGQAAGAPSLLWLMQNVRGVQQRMVQCWGKSPASSTATTLHVQQRRQQQRRTGVCLPEAEAAASHSRLFRPTYTWLAVEAGSA